MTKKWIKYYLLIGTLLLALVVLASSLLLVRNNLIKAQDKYEFESLYKNTDFDFKVPSPSFDQIEQEEKSSSNGVGLMAPYYSASMNVEINDKDISCDVQLFPEPSKMSITPYSASKILYGTKNYSGGEVIVDQAFAKKHGCNIGDSVAFAIRNNTFKYRITSVSETNKEYESGIIVIVLTNTDAQMLIDDKTVYSAAYVSADDYSACKQYLFNDYKPYGRLKDSSEFDSEDVYNRHYENFMSADWSEEITDYSANYNLLKVKYENVDSGILRNQIIVSVLIAVLLLVYSIVVLGSGSLRVFMKNYIVKKAGTVSKCANFFTSGILYMFVIYTIGSGLLFFKLSKGISKAILLGCSMNFLMPVAAALLISIVMVLISRATVKSRFSSNKIQTRS